MSDGGDGFGEVLSRLGKGKIQKVRTVDAAHRPCVVPWWWEPGTKTAIIESARVIGLAMLPPGEFHPFALDSFGMGALFLAAHRKGAKHCLVGIGGSATNDGGFGLARAMGWGFFDCAGNVIERWPDLQRLKKICPPPSKQSQSGIGARTGAPYPHHQNRAHSLGYSIEVAVDVQNPLLGPRGATRVYGPQKGLGTEDFKLAESCLSRMARIWRRDFGKDLSTKPGAGAAGGLGFGLVAFLGARLAPGFDLLAEHAGIEDRLDWANLVITGEGSIDKSSLMGKGVGQIGSRCLKRRIPCIGLAGVVTGTVRGSTKFKITRGLTELTSVEQAKTEPAHWLERLAAQVAREIKP